MGQATRKLTDRTIVRTEFWWNERKPDEPVLWESKIELGEKFFNEIISHPVPIDMNTLTALKRSSLGLDLYLWLVYRTFPLRAPLRLTWRLLYSQFGAHPAKASDKETIQNFRRKVLRELKKIKLAWPELNYSTAPGLLILHPSRPAIPPVRSSPANKLTSPFSASQRPVSGLIAPKLDHLGMPRDRIVRNQLTRLFPQACVNPMSFPRLFGTPPSASSSTIRDTPPSRSFDYSGHPYK